jgi:very-short-patch-repair endonuclease
MSFNPLPAKWWYLYHHATAPENALEPHVAALGWPYRFQHPLHKTFPDFAVFPRGLDKPGYVLEVDGPDHRTKAGLKKDAIRTEKLEGFGWVVVRCTNEEALADPAGTVTRMIEEAHESYRNKH